MCLPVSGLPPKNFTSPVEYPNFVYFQTFGAVFAPQRSSFPTLVVPRWIAPVPSESLPAYAGRFGAIPADLHKRIFAADVAAIETWVERAFEAPDLQSVFDSN